MRRNALTICCFVCAFGAFGAFFRWLQTQIAVDAVTGVQKPGMLNAMVPLVTIAAAVVFWFIIRGKMETCVFGSNMYDTFRGTTSVYEVMYWVIGCIMMLGGLISLVSIRQDPQNFSYKLIALLAIATGATFPAICNTRKKHFSPGLISTFATLPMLLYVIWLIGCYKRNASIPNVWSYCIEIIAVCAAIIAFYYMAGYPFGSPRPFAGLYSSMIAAFLCLTTLADNRYFGMQVILLGTVAMLLMYCWMIVSNMRSAEETAASAAKAAADAVAKPEPAPEPEPKKEEPVIPAGLEVNLDEPTIEAPARKKSVEELVDELKNL